MIAEHELDLLINDVFETYGYDFAGYSRASFKRRVNRLIEMDKLGSFPAFLSRVLSDVHYFNRMVEEITVNVTEMFRDPFFYKVLREQILPLIGAKPFIRTWHAGCSTGEEVYSMAIVLRELGLLHKTLLYATDINPAVVESAKKGMFPLRMMKDYSENYRLSGGKNDFSSYFTANYGHAKFDETLSERMVFSQHNLVSDRSFNEFDLILCRNVLIYFDKELQDHALSLFDESLALHGFLVLGTKENIKFSTIQFRYRQHEKDKIWRKIKAV